MAVCIGQPPGIALPSKASHPAIDLASAEYVANILLAGGVALTASQAFVLPSLITAASREMIRYCGRKFVLAPYSEIVTPEGGRQDRGEPASAKLSAFPVQSVTRVMTGRTTVLTVANRDPTANQIATVAFDVAGDVEYFDLTYVGLLLERTASGTTSTSSLPFAAYPTLNALAAAVNALGNGWSARVQAWGSVPEIGLFPSASLVGVREPKNALSWGAALDMFLTPASSFDIDRPTGILRCYGGSGSGSGNGFGGWSDAWGASSDGSGFGFGGGGGGGQWSVTYQAGWATVPENLQQVCAEVVKGIYARLEVDPALKSETADKYGWTAKECITSLPDWAMSALNSYKDWSV